MTGLAYRRHRSGVTLYTIALVVALAATAVAATPKVAPAAPAKPTPAIPAIDSVVARLNSRFADIKDITGTVDLEQVSADGSVIKAQTSVEARLPNLLRLKFIKPDAFAGSIYVLDRKANQVMQYSPITDQVMVSTIDQVLSERFVPTTVEQLFSLPSPDDYHLAVMGVEGDLVAVSAKAKSGGDVPLFHFWIDQQRWLVSKMKVFDANNKLLFTIGLHDVKLNQSLTDARLKKMPAGAVTVYR